MCKINLSILIATMPSRKESFHKLINDLGLQTCNVLNVEILSDDSIDINIGQKRNLLLSRAKGEYIVFIDDDDEVSSDYIALILNAAKFKSDCIGINGIITTNGKNKMQWYISKSYKKWFTSKGIYYRTPNHISPVKRELAMLAGFPDISHAEDFTYSMRLLPYLKTETIIKQPIYHYKFISNKTA